MKVLQPTTQFRKDLKRYRNQPKKLDALKEILNKLMNEEPIPDKYYPHPLYDDYKGCMECHIQEPLQHNLYPIQMIRYPP